MPIWDETSLVPRPFPPPVFDHILYQKWRGKAWEKGSHAWCQVDVRVDIRRGAVPDKESWDPSCNILSKSLRLTFETQRQYISLFSRFETDQRKVWVTTIGHHLPHVYPRIYLTSHAWLFLPGLPLPFLHTVCDQKLEAETAREWG